MELSGLDGAVRKARGAFFTPEAICDFICTWALRGANDEVLEPSCGEAAFLLSADRQLRSLGSRTPGRQVHTFTQLQGVEVHAESAMRASFSLASTGTEATIHLGDFFDCDLPGQFDAVVGNPPYVRYQDFTGESRARAQQRALAHGVRVNGLASSWAPFVVHAATFLRPEGRLGLVLPAELLSVNYAAPIRAFLMKRFASVRLVMFEGRVFPGVMEEVVLLLAEGTGPTDHFTVQQVRDVSDLGRLEHCASTWRPVSSDDKWSPALLPPGAADAYAALAVGGSFVRLKDWGNTSLGMVTGNNSYFALSADDARHHGLRAADLLKISPPGSKHLRGLTFTTKAWEEMRDGGARTFLFYPRSDRLSTKALEYVAHGEALSVESAYKCRVRTPWWRVPLVATPHLFLTYMNHDTPRLVRNQAQVPHVNSVHGVSLKRGRVQLGQDWLPMASLNSLTLLGAELVGRSYGGGMLKLEPTEADALPVPSPLAVEALGAELSALRPQLASAQRGGQLQEAVRLVDEILLVGHLGLSRRKVKALRDAHADMRARRAARGADPRGTD